MLKQQILCGVFIVLLAGCGGAEQKQLNVFAWANYVSDEIRSDFEKEFDARVVVDTFASNEDLLTKLQSGASGYDIIMPSDYMVGIMVKQGLLAKLDWENIPNYNNVSPQFLKYVNHYKCVESNVCNSFLESTSFTLVKLISAKSS